MKPLSPWFNRFFSNRSARAFSSCCAISELVGSNLDLIATDVHLGPPAGAVLAGAVEVGDAGFTFANARGRDNYSLSSTGSDETQGRVADYTDM